MKEPRKCYRLYAGYLPVMLLPWPCPEPRRGWSFVRFFYRMPANKQFNGFVPKCYLQPVTYKKVIAQGYGDDNGITFEHYIRTIWALTAIIQPGLRLDQHPLNPESMHDLDLPPCNKRKLTGINNESYDVDCY